MPSMKDGMFMQMGVVTGRKIGSQATSMLSFPKKSRPGKPQRPSEIALTTCCGHQILHRQEGIPFRAAFTNCPQRQTITIWCVMESAKCLGKSLSCLSFCIVLFKIFWGLLEASMICELQSIDLSRTFRLAKLEGVPIRLHPTVFWGFHNPSIHPTKIGSI